MNYYMDNSILAIWFFKNQKSKILKLSNQPKQNKINKIQKGFSEWKEIQMELTNVNFAIWVSWHG